MIEKYKERTEEVENYIKEHFIFDRNSLLLDNEVILTNDSGFGWKFVRGNIHEHTKLKSSNFQFILDDLADQLMNGVQRKELVLNIPVLCEIIKMNDKYYIIES
jgi:hypothetical protein